MPLIRTINDLPVPIGATPAVVSIGNYDGVHLGHQSVIKQLKAQAQKLALPMVLITFNPLAKEYFAAKYSSKLLESLPARLTGINQRTKLLKFYGVDYVICLDFDEKLETQTAEQFVQTLLVDTLQTQFLVVGDDFHFGFQRKGDFAMLTQAGQQHGFVVQSMNTFEIDNKRVSSGRVREALAGHDFTLVRRLLGREYSISGCVIKGQQLGSSIGFPTANIDMAGLANSKLPLTGVYAVKTHIEGFDHVFYGVANIGVRPTVDGMTNSLEVHLFDFQNNEVKQSLNKARQSNDTEASYALYGLELEVFFMHAIRDEQKFSDVDELTQQISVDVVSAKQFFASQITRIDASL